MVLSVCLNPSVDICLQLDSLVPGGMNRVHGRQEIPSGKGVNTACTLARLGMESTLLVLAPREGKAGLEERVARDGARMVAVDRPGALRQNIKLREKNGRITEVNAPGLPVRAEDVDAFIAAYDALVLQAEGVLLTGSLPPGCPAELYARLVARARGRIIGVDGEGIPLRLALEAGPSFVKPNRYELESLMGRKLDTLEACVQAAGEIASEDTHVLLSLSEQGALLHTGREVYLAPALDVPVISTVGAGDAMAAAYLRARLQAMRPRNALQLAVAAAADCVAGGRGVAEGIMTQAWTHKVAIRRLERA
nr:hexose kinase [bacterium]